MDLRSHAKQTLRMCGHAIVSTIHERLSVVDRVLQEILDQNTHIASTQTALLQSGVHLVETVARIQADLQQLPTRQDLEALSATLNKIRDTTAEKTVLLALGEQVGSVQNLLAQSGVQLAENFTSIQAALAQIREIAAEKSALHTLSEQLASTQNALLKSEIHVIETLGRLPADMESFEARLTVQVRDRCASKADLQAISTALTQIHEIAAERSALHTLSEELANTQNAVLKSEIHVIETLGRLPADIESFEARLTAQVRDQCAGKADLQAISAALAQIREVAADKASLLALGEQVAATQSALTQSGVHLAENLVRVQAGMKDFEARLAAQVRDQSASKADLQAISTALAQIREIAAGKSELQALYDRIQDMRQHLDHALQSQLDTLQSQLDTLPGLNTRIEKAQEAGTAIVQSGIDRMLSLTEATRHAIAGSVALLEPIARDTNNFLVNQSVKQVCVETSNYLSTNPELDLFSFLYSYLPSRTALDIGAHIGDVSEHLLKTGYEVYAFEPFPDSYRHLRKRLKPFPGFHAFNMALGSATGELPLHLVTDHSPDNRYEDATVFNSLAPHGMPEGLTFNGTIPVKIRKVSELHKENLIPADASIVKIDTEGYDLEVVRGMDDHHYPLVMVEFWDTSLPFATDGLLYTPDSMVSEMRQRGYLWYIFIYRVWGENQTAFFCNHARSVPGSWGNIIFFQKHELFARAEQWCSAVLPRTYFKHVPAENELKQKIMQART